VPVSRIVRDARSTTPPEADDATDPGVIFVAFPEPEREFVRSLVERLEVEGKRCWWAEKIVAPEPWRDAIEREIPRAAVLVFVLTPGSIDPKSRCLDELDIALAAGVGIVVVRRADVPRDGVPADLGKPHWVNLRPDDPYEEGVLNLLMACSANPDWNAGRTRFQPLALQWAEHERDPSLLLRGVSLKDAERWQERERPEHQTPPMEVVGRFVAASQAKARKDRRRQRAIAGLVGTALVALALGLVVELFSALDQRGKARHQTTVAESLALATLGANLPTDRSYAALALGYEAHLENDSPEARRMILEALQLTGPPALVTILHGHRAGVSDATFSPDGRTIATASDDRTAQLWDTDTGSRLHVLNGHADGVQAVAFSPDGRMLATTGIDRTVRLWDVRSGRQVHKRATLTYFPTSIVFGGGGDTVAASGPDGPGVVWASTTGHQLATLEHRSQPSVSHHIDLAAAEPLFPLAVSPDGELFVTGGEDDSARVWDARTGRRVTALSTGAEAASAFAFSRDSRYVAVAGYDHSVRVFDLSTHERIATLRGHTRAVQSLAFSRDTSTIFAAAGDRAALFWDIRSEKQVGRVLGIAGSAGRSVTEAQYSPDGKLAATADGDGTVRLFVLGTHRSVTLAGQGSALSALRFSADSRRLLTAGGDGTARVWDTRGAFASQLVGHDSPIRAVAVSPNGRLAATGSEDFRVGLWDTRTGRRQRWLPGHRDTVVTVAFSADGTRLFSAARDDTVRISDVRTGAAMTVLRGHRDGLSAAAYSPDGRIVAAGSDDWTVRLWHADTGAPIATVRHGSIVQDVAFSPDSSLVASAGSSATVRLWNARNGHLVAKLKGRDGQVDHVAFVPHSHLLAAPGRDGVLQLWDTRTHVRTDTAKLAGPARRLAVSPDGHAIATGADSGEIELWDARTARRLAPLSGQRFGITALTFSADSRTLISAAGDDSIRIWDVGSGRALDALATESEVDAIALSRDGTFLVGGGSAHAARIWRNIGWRDADGLRDTVCQTTGGGLTRAEWTQSAPGLAYRNHCA
jgi:WD40 repeat protein